MAVVRIPTSSNQMFHQQPPKSAPFPAGRKVDGRFPRMPIGCPLPPRMRVAIANDVPLLFIHKIGMRRRDFFHPTAHLCRCDRLGLESRSAVVTGSVSKVAVLCVTYTLYISVIAFASDKCTFRIMLLLLSANDNICRRCQKTPHAMHPNLLLP